MSHAHTLFCPPFFPPRHLDLVDEPEQDENSPLRQPIRTPRDVRDQDTDVAMSQSSWTSTEDTSAEDSCTDEEHDQELFLEAYTAFTTKSDDVGSVDSLRRWFSSVERLPDSWPLARLSITLDGLTSQLSKVVMSATMEIIASCRYPDYGLPSVTQLAKDVTVALLTWWLTGYVGYWINKLSFSLMRARRACCRLHTGYGQSMRNCCIPHLMPIKDPL